MRGRALVRALGLLGAVGIALAGAVVENAGAAPRPRPPALEHLAPGERAIVEQDLPVTIVFVGLEDGDGPMEVDGDGLVDAQPRHITPIDRFSQFARDEVPDALGLEYDVDVTAVFADEAFEDAFFGYLSTSGFGPLPPTFYQSIATAHPDSAVDITENWVLDATAVENWLLENAGPMLGVDTERPTVFLVNWYGRPDFRFHTYAYFSFQPEIGLFPPARHHLQMTAWGGGAPDHRPPATSRLGRVWFYDLSAGPEWNTVNFILDAADLNADGVADERIPPIWEYGTSHWFRPFDDLTGDLAGVVRFVAIDALFAASPIYPPALSPPLLDDVLELDINVFLDDPQRDPFDMLLPHEVRRRLAGLDPSRGFTTDVEVRPVTPGLSRVIDCDRSSGTLDPSSCYPGMTGGDPTSDIAIWLEHHRLELLDQVRGEVPVAVLDVSDERESSYSGMTIASSWGIQRWATVWTTPALRSTGLYSPTATTTHEVGHYLGLAHPHDVHDSELGVDLNPFFGGPAFFLFLGDETASTMSYLHNATDFSQFDRDNLARYLVAVRLHAANAILGDVYASPRAWLASAELGQADAKAGDALDLVRSWDLLDASRAAAEAHALVLAAAAKAGVAVEPWAPAGDEAGVGAVRTVDLIDLGGLRDATRDAGGSPSIAIERPDA